MIARSPRQDKTILTDGNQAAEGNQVTDVSNTPRVVQIKLDIRLDDKKFYNAPTHIAQIASEIAAAAAKAVDDCPAAVSATSVDVEWAWLYAWASGSSAFTWEDDVDYDP